MISEANRRGGLDNITGSVIRIEPDGAPDPDVTAPTKAIRPS
jgi:hypothetical protein